jgi:hypothetical protein
MVEVVDLNARRKPVDAELVDKLRILLSEAQNGRMTGIVAGYYDDQGDYSAMFHMEWATDAIAAATMLQSEALKLLEE